jgi:ankyrin repeat protein/cytochrome c551/c552
MFRPLLLGGVLIACVAGYSLSASSSAAQPVAKVDFARDVQPIFQQSCIGCHGPSQQMVGLRLDRRLDAMRGGAFGAVIGPGNSVASRLFLRVSGTRVGTQMPPTGALRPEQIELIKNWIDQGAEWPDAVANDAVPPPPDPGATRLIDAIRAGDAARVTTAIDANAGAINAKGAGGATPLMWAALDGNLQTMSKLIERGADPNLANESGVTPLMWAIPDLEKARLLLERGADPNVKSKDQRTPLIMAASVYGSSELVKLLLDTGARPSETGLALFGPITALTEAAYAGDMTTFRLLLERGLEPKVDAPVALLFALRAGCSECAEMLARNLPPPVLGVAAAFAGPPLGDARAMKFFLDRGADVNSRDLEGRSLLTLAAGSDALPIEVVQMLLAKGADVHTVSQRGETAVGFASRRGQTPVLDALLKAGAKPDAPAAPPTPHPASSARAAIERSLPLLQRSDVTFMRKSGCVSCHNNSVAALTVAAARARAIKVDENIARDQRNKIGAFLESWRERTLQGIGIPGDADTISYILLGLGAEKYPAGLGTDAMVRFLLHRQAGDGRWYILAHRPPIESSDLQVTAATVRALQLYAPQKQRAGYDRAIARAVQWIANAKPVATEEHAFKLLGLKWGQSPATAIQTAAQDLVAAQRPDGGWSQIATLGSDAYATGQALYALVESGAIGIDNPSYKRGAQYLLSRQLADGSWFVQSRAVPLQPHFESDFPHGRDQFISAAATGWANLALAHSVQ